MKQLNAFQSKISNSIITTTAAITIFFINNPPAYAQGLKKAEGALNELKSGLTKIVPIAATIILLCLAVSYAGRFIEKSTFLRWAIGVVIAGSAFEITTLLFSKNGG
ncbi:VirB2 family type IV secretion system major pilin TrwL [Bartonella sp. B12(2025)]